MGPSPSSLKIGATLKNIDNRFGLSYKTGMSTQKIFLREIETFLSETGMTASRLGWLSTGDPSLVFDLRNGRDLKTSTMDKVRQCMRAHTNDIQPKRGRPRLTSSV